MKRVAVLYATRYGHTQKIAEHVVRELNSAGFEAEAHNLADTSSVNLARFTGVVVAGSVHVGKHESELSQFVKANRALMETMPTALLSVSLSEAGAERADYCEKERAEAAADVARLIHEFEAETGWHPGHVQPVAGALLYSRYNLLIRFVMKRIAKHARADTDTSHDYDYTNWPSLDRFIQEFAAEVLRY